MAELDDLAFFQTLAGNASLTAAARELGMSLSAVSKRLTQLEARLGVQLIQRTTRRLSLTAEGEHYAQRGRDILADVGELENTLAAQHAELSGPLRINATFGFGRAHVAPLVSDFVTLHPQLDVLLELSDYPLNLTEHGLDLGILIGTPPDSRLVARRILANRRIVCAAPDYLRRCGTPRTIEELSEHNCLIVRENDSSYAVWRFVDDGRERAIKVKGSLASNDGEVITRLALDGHGIMLRSWWHVHRHLARGELVALLPGYDTPRADFHAVFPQRRFVSARLREFIDFLAAQMAQRVPPLPDDGQPR